MVSSVLLLAMDQEEILQRMIAGYRDSFSRIQSSRKPEEKILIPDIEKSRKEACSNIDDPLHSFLNVDSTITISSRNQIASILSCYDSSTFDDRCENMGHYSFNNGVLAVVDGQGKLYVAKGTQQNLDFLKSNGYQRKSFYVPLSNGEEIVGILGKPYSYSVHRAASEILGIRDPMSLEAFEQVVRIANRVNDPRQAIS